MHYNYEKEKYNLNRSYCNSNKVYNQYYYRSNYNIYMSKVPINKDVGYIKIYVTKNLGKEIAKGAVLTIYARRGENDQAEVKRLVIENNPTIIELPIAHNLGTLIEGPEYFFTTYNLTIEEEGYYRIITRNIRLFPNITAEFQYNLNLIIQDKTNQDEIIEIPLHPIDIIN